MGWCLQDTALPEGNRSGIAPLERREPPLVVLELWFQHDFFVGG